MSARGQEIRAWWAARPLLADAALAALLTLAFALAALGGEGRPAGTWLLVAGLTAPLAWRRRAPLPAFAAVALVVGVQLASGRDLLLADMAGLIALYSVAVHEPRRWAFPAAFAVSEVGALLAVLRFSVGSLLLFASASAFVVAAAALGVYVRTRREHIAALELRAGELERERDQGARLAAAAERARIARELHDVVAHNLTVMIALADGARLTAAGSPQEADAAMGSVSATGREALGEMRRLLGVLREEGGVDEGAGAGAPNGAGAASVAGAGAPPLRPQPGIEQLEALLAQVRGAGLPTRLVRSGEPAALSPGAQLTVYRVVQEALTNTLKHAHQASAAEVRLQWGREVLVVEVRDDGSPSPEGAANGHESAAGGHGLAGMRERAAAYGAVVEAGPGPGGGWYVRTELPLGSGQGT